MKVVGMWIAVLKLSQRNSELEAESSHSQRELGELRAKCDALRRQNEELVLANTGKMAVDEHINALAALKQYVLQLCQSYLP